MIGAHVGRRSVQAPAASSRFIMRTLARLLISCLVALPVVLLSQSSAIPTPESALGFAPGTDYKLANYEQVLAYFQKVAAASDLVRLVPAGKTTDGRTFYFALVSSKANLDRLPHYLEINRRLAHPEGLTDDQAHALAREGKAFVHIDGGLHASEVAGAQQTPKLLYDIVSHAGDPDMAQVLDNVIFMLWPTINPDGMTMVADWYMSHVGTPDANAPLPTLYQEYVGHDNNRDAYMLDMIESRVMEYTWRQWEPDIVYVMHQAPPFPYRIWLPPFAAPIAADAPPIPSAEVNMIGMAIQQGLDEHGQSGATHMGTGFDAWYPGYIDYAPIFKNIPSFWTEVAGNGANPQQIPPDRFQPGQLIPQPLYTNPYRGGTWRLADAVGYDETAALSVLEYAAKYKVSLLYGRYQSGRDQIREGQTGAPYAYIIPQQQRDPVAPVELLRRLAFCGVRVSQLTAPATIGTVSYPAGTWIVPTDQEYAAVAREVLDTQVYPDVRESPNGPLDQPYDAAGWTLPFSMGVTVRAADAPLASDVRAKMRLLGPLPDPALTPEPYNLTASGDAAPFDSVPGIGFNANPNAAAIVPPEGTITGQGAALAVDPAQNNAFRALNRAWKAGLDVQYAAGGSGRGARYLIDGLSATDQSELVKSLALTAERVGTKGEPVKRPRLGVFEASTSMDEGWTRWVLEQYGFDFTRVPGSDIEAGNLKDTIDVLIVTDEARGVLEGGRGGRGRGGAAPGGPARAGGGGAARAGGAARGAGAAGGARGGGRGFGRGGPAPLTPADEARIKAIDDFVRAGGTLVCFNRSSNFAIDQLHLPVKNVVAGIGRTEFFAGGSLLYVLPDPTQRVMAGMPDKAAVFYDGGPVFETEAGFEGAVLAHYQDSGSPLASGYLLGEQYLQGKAAALDVDLGQGHVILLGFRPQWRGQPFGTFRVIFNAATYTQR
jgi:Zinc carboxypeptidase